MVVRSAINHAWPVTGAKDQAVAKTAPAAIPALIVSSPT
jgi:hypothetical protein